LTLSVLQRLAGAIQQHQLDAAQMPQQAQVEQLADIALAGEVQAQLLEVEITEVAVGTHRQAQAEQRAIALDRVIQAIQRKRQHFGGKGGAKATGHALDRLGFHRSVARHRQRRAGTLERVELQHAEGRQRAHIVRPQQVHERMGQLRQLVVELLPQAPSQKGETLQQSFDIRVAPALPKKRRQRRTALGKALAQLAQGSEFALVVVVKGHLSRPSLVRVEKL